MSTFGRRTQLDRRRLSARTYAGCASAAAFSAARRATFDVDELKIRNGGEDVAFAKYLFVTVAKSLGSDMEYASTSRPAADGYFFKSGFSPDDASTAIKKAKVTRQSRTNGLARAVTTNEIALTTRQKYKKVGVLIILTAIIACVFSTLTRRVYNYYDVRSVIGANPSRPIAFSRMALKRVNQILRTVEANRSSLLRGNDAKASKSECGKRHVGREVGQRTGERAAIKRVRENAKPRVQKSELQLRLSHRTRRGAWQCCCRRELRDNHFVIMPYGSFELS
ncbi:hypothetical protein EVAR_21489_1 [Eumeta japonica]|uniref:Uncharacterized protein n=1 Tax=Eumeta variegata TaxID=151549 RepID=A0A4C1UY56_EUMVA|nr:hypothetical protein EVAR_21489_1 [Eumeta japonica]